MRIADSFVDELMIEGATTKRVLEPTADENPFAS